MCVCVFVCVLCVCVFVCVYTQTHTHIVEFRFATVEFTTIHFYDSCRVGPSTPDLWCTTVATQASFLYLLRFQLFSGLHVFLVFLFQCSSFKLDCDFSTHDVHQKDRKEEKNQNSRQHVLSWCFMNHGLGLLQQNKKWSDWYFFQLSV